MKENLFKILIMMLGVIICVFVINDYSFNFNPTEMVKQKNTRYLKQISITENQLLSLVSLLHQLEYEDLFPTEIAEIDKALEKSGIFREGESYQESEPVK